jgi:hypothetical protein
VRGGRGPAPRSPGAGGRAYRGAVRGFSLVFVALGLVLLAVTLAHGGGPASVGVLMGAIFVAVGAGRLWVASRMER